MGDRGNPFSHYDEGLSNIPRGQPQPQRQMTQSYYPQENMTGNKLDELKKIVNTMGNIVYNTKQDLDIKMDILEKKMDELNVNLVMIKESVTANNNLQTAITVAVLGEGLKESKVLTEECEKMRESISTITEHIKKGSDVDEEE